MSDSHLRPTDLRPPEFEVAEDDPFASDRLNRKESVESLCSVIGNAEGPLVVSVEGAYGTGKSSFLRMCAARLGQLETQSVEFNAWQQGHTGRPLIDLVAALAAKLEDQNSWETVKDTAKQVGWRTATYLSRGLIAPNESDAASVFNDWAVIETNVSGFKESLHAQVQECGGKLVIFVDELDRCEPIYALDLLNKARHLFDVPGVVIVFGVNRTELGHAVETQYGPDCKVDGYLRRFVDLSMQLRQPTNEEWATYVSHICVSVSERSAELRDASHAIRDLLLLLANNCGGRLRDVEQVVRHANLALPSRNYDRSWPVWVICLLTLRYVDRDSYERFVNGIIDLWGLLQVMREHFPIGGDGKQLAILDSIVLLMPGEGHVPHDKDEFVKQYTTIRQDKADDALAAHGWYERFGGRSGDSGQQTLEALHRTIEFAAPN